MKSPREHLGNLLSAAQHCRRVFKKVSEVVRETTRLSVTELWGCFGFLTGTAIGWGLSAYFTMLSAPIVIPLAALITMTAFVLAVRAPTVLLQEQAADTVEKLWELKDREVRSLRKQAASIHATNPKLSDRLEQQAADLAMLPPAELAARFGFEAAGQGTGGRPAIRIGKALGLARNPQSFHPEKSGQKLLQAHATGGPSGAPS